MCRSGKHLSSITRNCWPYCLCCHGNGGTGRSAGRVVGWCDGGGVRGLVHCHLEVRGRRACEFRPSARARTCSQPTRNSLAAGVLTESCSRLHGLHLASQRCAVATVSSPHDSLVFDDVFKRTDGHGSNTLETKRRSLRNPRRPLTRLCTSPC